MQTINLIIRNDESESFESFKYSDTINDIYVRSKIQEGIFKEKLYFEDFELCEYGLDTLICETELCEGSIIVKKSKYNADQIADHLEWFDKVEQDGYELRHVKHQTDEIYLAAVQQDDYALKYIWNQTDKIILAMKKTPQTMVTIIV